MKARTTTSLIAILVFSLLFSACSTQVNVTGQIDPNQGTGSLNIDIGGGENGSGNTSGDTGSGQQPANQPPIISSQGMLILFGIALVVIIGLLIGLARAKGQS